MMTHLYTYRCRSHEETTENKKVAGLLGVLMRCCVYLGIDETLTRDRVRYLLTEAEVQEVLVAGSAFDLPLCKTVDVLGLPERPFSPPVRAAARPDPDAYLMYTSGSTGLPKAVRITHHQLLRLCRAFITDWDSRMKPGDHALGLIAYAWDMHLLDIFMPLLQGATLQTLTEAERLDGSRVAPYFADQRPRWCQGTPTLYRALLSSGWDGLGSGNLTCISSGEPLTPPLAANLIPRCGSVVNCYGLTEGTIFQSFSFARDAEKITCGNSCYPDPHYGRTYVIVDGVALTPSDSSGKVSGLPNS